VFMLASCPPEPVAVVPALILMAMATENGKVDGSLLPMSGCLLYCHRNHHNDVPRGNGNSCHNHIEGVDNHLPVHNHVYHSSSASAWAHVLKSNKSSSQCTQATLMAHSQAASTVGKACHCRQHRAKRKYLKLKQLLQVGGPVQLFPPIFCWGGGRPNFRSINNPKKNRQMLNKERPIF
jgi:hypothetical protein